MIEAALYLLIGFTCFIFIIGKSVKEIMKAFLFVIGWPYFLLLKYVEYVEESKRHRHN